MPATPEEVAVGTVKVVVNTETGSVSLNPQTTYLNAVDGKLTYELGFAPGTSGVGVRAYVVLLKHNKLTPSDAAKGDGYQDNIFALRDVNGNDLSPTFIAKAQGEESPLVVVLFPEGSPYSSFPAQSVVIIDS